MSAHQLRILASTTATASASVNANGEQDPAVLFDQMAELFQLTPLPRRRTTVMSPSVVAIDALLNDIGDPQRLLSEMVTAAALSSAPSHLEPTSALKQQQQQKKKKRKSMTTATDKTAAAAASANVTKKPKRAPTVAAATKMPVKRKDTTSAGTTSSATRTPPKTAVKTEPADSRASSPSHTDPTVAADSRDVIVNVSRARQKKEMVHLRVKVRELERELLKLGTKSPHASTLPSGNNSNSSSTVDKQTQQSSGWNAARKPIWERLANGAKDRKRHAEVENLRLRETVATQKKLSRSLEKILMKRTNLLILGASPPTTTSACLKRIRASEIPVSTARCPEEKDDEHVFHELSTQLDLQYQRLDQMLKVTGLTTKTIEWQRCEIVTESSKNVSGSNEPMMVECCDVKHFPFAVDAVAEAVWRCATVRVIKDVHYVAEVVRQTKSVAHTRTTITVKKPSGQDLVLHVKSVMKRVTEPHRRVLLHKSVTSVAIDAQEAEDTASRTLLTSDEGWVTIESISDDARLPASILRMCMRAQLSEPQAALSLSTLLVDTCTQVLRARQQLIENFLLEHLLAKKSVNSTRCASSTPVR